jgi:hydroxyacylglutathione hydrolase
MIWKEYLVMENIPFVARKFNKNTWVIEGVGCYSYLVLGSGRAMMVDTGMSKTNLREFVETLTELPVSVVNTHGHFDHTGGNGWFDEVYMHPSSVGDAKKCFGDTADYPLDYEIKTVTEGYIFDLGGRTLEVIEIPAHNAGSIALLDKENRMLFTGDELEAGQVLLMLGNGSVEEHQANMKKLKERINEFDIICPAHNGTPIDNSYVDAYIENDQRVMDGIEGKMEIHSPSFPAGFMPGNEYLRRSEYKGSSIVYDTRTIFGKK